MNIKYIISAIGIALFSLNALSAGNFRVNLGDLDINAAAHKLPQEAMLGNGWKMFEPNESNGVCIADNSGEFTYLPQINGKSTGLSFKDGSGDYPVFSSNIDGIGYAVGVRQKGTSRWYPLTGNNSPISALDGTSILLLETRMVYVKTVQGNIDGKENASTQFEPIRVQCNGNLNWEHRLGEILPTSTIVKWAERTCDVKTTRQSVNLGIHDLAKVRSLKVGETFGHAQQSITIDCPSKMSIFYTIADNFHPSNISTNVIYLENENENPGFGVQIFESGKSTPLRLGGDRSLSSAHLYSLLTTGAVSQVVNKTFDFKYVKLSDDVKASNGNAQVTVTLVYK